MDVSLANFLSGLRRSTAPVPADLPTALRALPEPVDSLSPWEAWTLIGLARHLPRQMWVAEVVSKRLRGSPSEIAEFGALGHPEKVPQSGPVPGSPEWEYYFHGRGCCIAHKVDGDRIDVDFYDETPDYFDTFFYVSYLESLRRPEPIEQRIRQVHRHPRNLRVDILPLLGVEALTALEDDTPHPYRLSEAVVDRLDDFTAFSRAWPDESRRVWTAALIGDWLAADDAARGLPEIESIIGPRAEQCRAMRRKKLQRPNGFAAFDALRALVDLGNADAEIEEALRGEPNGLVSTALDVIEEENDPRWCKHLYPLFRRVNPAGGLPQPRIWMRSLKFLLRHGDRPDEMIAAILKTGGTEVGEGVLMALEHAPEHALPLIRKSLLSHIPINRIEVAATLAVIGKAWCIRELLRALKESDDQEKTAEARAALIECGDDAAHNAVLTWEEKNPHANEVGSYIEVKGKTLGPFFTFGEHALKNCGDRIRYEMDKLHDRVMKFKDIVPPDPASK